MPACACGSERPGPLTVFSSACYKPNMWKRLQLVSGVALLATIAITFSASPIALQNPPAGEPPRPQAPPPTGGTLSSTSNAGADFSPKPALKARTPKEEAASFLLPPGYRMELVLAE